MNLIWQRSIKSPGQYEINKIDQVRPKFPTWRYKFRIGTDTKMTFTVNHDEKVFLEQECMNLGGPQYQYGN